MQNKTARIITIVVVALLVIGAFFAYIYRGKLKGLFGHAAGTIDLGFTNGIQPLTIPCPVPGPDGTQQLDATATLINYDHDNATIVTATGVKVALHVFSYNKSDPSVGFPGIPSWMQVTLNGTPVTGELLDIPDLGPGQSAIIHISGTVPSDQMFNLTGEVDSADQTDVDSTPHNWENTDEDDKFGIGCALGAGGGGGGGGGNTAIADLSLTKQVDAPTVAVNATSTFTVVVTNSGPNATTGVTVGDKLPDGLSFISGAATQGTYDSATGVWTIGQLGLNQTATLTLKAKVTKAGTFLNTAEVTASALPDPDSTPNNHNANEDDQASAVVSTSAITGGGSACLPQTQNAQINQTVSFQVVASPGETVNNWEAPGGTPATGTGVTFSTKYTTAGTKTVTVHSDNNTGTCTVIVGTPPPGGGDLVCSPSTQNAQTNQTVSFSVTPVPGITDPFTWDATGGTPATGTGTSFSTKYGSVGTKTVTVHVQNSTGTCTVVVGTPPVGPTLSCTPATQDATIDQTVSFTGTGGGLTHTWDAPEGTPTGGAVSASGSGSSITSKFSTKYSTTGTKKVTVASGALSASCTVTVTAGGGGGNPVTDLGVVKSVSAASVSVGSDVVFSMVVTNNGPLNATNVKLSDPAVTGLGYVSNVASKGAYDPATGVWTVGDLAVGANATLSITMTVSQAATMTNVITITDVSPTDSNPDNNKAQASVTGTTGGGGCGTSCGGGGGGGCTSNCGGGGGGGGGPAPSADLSLSKVVSNSQPLVGTQVTYILNLLNSGPSTATGVSVGDLVPQGETFISALPSQGAYDPATGVWTVGTLAAGSSTALQLTVRVNIVGTIVNTGEVTSSDQPDVDSTPNNHNPSEDDQASIALTSHGSAILPAAGLDSRGSVAVGSLFLLMLFVIQFFIPTKRRKFVLSFVAHSDFWSDTTRFTPLTEHKPKQKLKW